jgi:hypothetical protein
MFSWRVTPDGGEPYIVEAGTRDVLAWERATGGSAQQLQEKFHVANAYWLAHRAAVRAGQFSGSRKEFEQSVDLETGVAAVAAEDDDGSDDDGSDDDGSDPT